MKRIHLLLLLAASIGCTVTEGGGSLPDPNSNEDIQYFPPENDADFKLSREAAAREAAAMREYKANQQQHRSDGER